MTQARRPRTPPGMRAMREAKSDRANRVAAQAMQAECLRWYAFQTAPAAEWRAHAILAELDMPSYLPWLSVKRKANRHTAPKLTRFTIIPRLLFVAFEPGHERFMEALAVDPVKSVVGMSGVPRGLDGGTLHAFLRRIGAEQEAIETTPRPVYHPGQRVRISSGAFAGRVVEVSQIRGPKARVLAEVMGTMQEVEVRSDGLEAV